MMFGETKNQYFVLKKNSYAGYFAKIGHSFHNPDLSLQTA